MTRLVSISVALALIAGCNKQSGKDKIISVSGDDPAMNTAIKKARDTVGTFIAALNSPKPNQDSFTVKMAFVDGKQTEHMWLSPVRYDGNRFHGIVNNDPELVSNVKIGQTASVDPAQISDWMFVENGKLVGGYTIRVLREKMSPRERAEFDQRAPFRID
jgi:uncharacterized protein YegJ (DUF2314 family)